MQRKSKVWNILSLDYTAVSDLSPLAHVEIERLHLWGLKVASLAPCVLCH